MNSSESSGMLTAGRKRRNTTDRVAELFLGEISSGRWPVGSRIPVEAELMRWSEAGRNTVREAISSLVQSGLVQREQGRGTFVISRSQLTQSVTRRVSSGARRDGLELRYAIDSAASALAARRRTDEDVVRLRSLLEARSESWRDGDVEARVRADTDLHSAIVDATHNELFIEVYDGLIGLFETVLHSDVQEADDPHAAEHAGLVRAIIDRNGDAARQYVAILLEPLITPLTNDATDG